MLNIFGMQADCRKRDAYSLLGSSGTLEPAGGHCGQLRLSWS